VRIAIVGAGMMGTATSFPLAARGHEVTLVGTPLDGAIVRSVQSTRRHPRLGLNVAAGVRAVAVEALAETVAASEAIVLGVSSAGLSWAGHALSRALPGPRSIAMVTKGLEPEDGGLRILPDRLRDALPAPVRVEPVMIAGPCIAGELARGTPSTVALASRDPEAARRFADLAVGPLFAAAIEPDVIGACVCAALKNAYAVVVGIATGLHERAGGPSGPVAHHNLEAALFGRALAEMGDLVEALGGRRATALGLAGGGDLFVTCQGGRSTRLGRLLGLGRTLAAARAELSTPEAPVTLEGVDVTEIVTAVRTSTEAPLLHRLRRILFDGAPADSIAGVP